MRTILVASDAPTVRHEVASVTEGPDLQVVQVASGPEVVEAVDDRIEVLLDGGVRRGGDVVKAVALGARAVLIGRPYIWALAAGGHLVLADLFSPLLWPTLLAGRRGKARTRARATRLITAAGFSSPRWHHVYAAIIQAATAAS